MRLEEMVMRLLLAFLAGAIVGMEREQTDRPAGLRTHMLVSGGSALFTLVSVALADGPGDDRTRIASQIVTGIGFLGAGTIFRSGTSVRGLTTAAGLWTVAAIGMGIGVGGPTLWLGLIAAVSVLVINRWVRPIERGVMRTQSRVEVRTSRGSDALARVLEALDAEGAAVDRVRWLPEDSNGDEAVLEMRVQLPAGLTHEELTTRILDQAGVHQVDWV
jgi:putative Mg2+ transporter-C (MgtC) family protein